MFNHPELSSSIFPSISFLSLNIGRKTNLNARSFHRSDEDLTVPIKPFSESLKFIIDQDYLSYQLF